MTSIDTSKKLVLCFRKYSINFRYSSFMKEKKDRERPRERKWEEVNTESIMASNSVVQTLILPRLLLPTFQIIQSIKKTSQEENALLLEKQLGA